MKPSVEVAAKAAPSSKAVDPPGSYYGDTCSTVQVPLALPKLLNKTPPSLNVQMPIALSTLPKETLPWETPPLPQLNGQCFNEHFPPRPLSSQNETPFILVGSS
jgi:hypothetical protein